jgi:hypothetical protein
VVTTGGSRTDGVDRITVTDAASAGVVLSAVTGHRQHHRSDAPPVSPARREWK